MIFSDAQGRISPEPPKVSLLDHGFLFGDSIYEVVRFYERKPFGWKEHLERLQKSAARLQISLENILPVLEKRSKEVLRSLGEPNAVLRMIVTRGEGALHIHPKTCPQPQLYLAAWKFDDSDIPKSVRVKIVSIERNSKKALDPAIKSGNYLNNVMAIQEASAAGFDDALFLNADKNLTELTTSNMGWVIGGQAFTPSVKTGILHGITRGFFLDWIGAKEAEESEQILENADEIFALSTLKEVVPISEVGFSNGRSKLFSPASTKWIEQYRADFSKKRSEICEALEPFYPL